MRVKDYFPVLMTFVLLSARVTAGILVVGELSHEYTMQPGDSIRGRIEVMNQGEESEQVRVYQTDYDYKADGTNHYNDPGQAERSNANWMEYSPRQFVVLPGERVIVNYVIRVPEEDLAGTYWSMMMVEPVQNLEPDESISGFQVLTVFRYAIQIITTLGDANLISLRFDNVQLTREENGLFLQMDVENNGDMIVRPSIWAELFGSTGTFAGKFEARKGRLLPGTSIRRQVDISRLEPGRYKALIVGDCGGDDIFGIELNIEVQEPPDPEAP